MKMNSQEKDGYRTKGRTQYYPKKSKESYRSYQIKHKSEF